MSKFKLKLTWILSLLFTIVHSNITNKIFLFCFRFFLSYKNFIISIPTSLSSLRLAPTEWCVTCNSSEIATNFFFLYMHLNRSRQRTFMKMICDNSIMNNIIKSKETTFSMNYSLIRLILNFFHLFIKQFFHLWCCYWF